MAAGKGNNNSILLLESIFQASFGQIANLLANAGSPLTNVYVSLHTANPGATGDQTTSEAAYTSYARVAVVRSAVGWTLASETISNAAIISFPAATGGNETETYAGVGTVLSGAGTLLWFGALTTGLAVSVGITPQIAIGGITVTES